MTVQEMARILLELSPEDETALQIWSEVEDATFQSYASDYFRAVPGCKTCHNG